MLVISGVNDNMIALHSDEFIEHSRMNDDMTRQISSF
jgi:hypothetical protein